MNRFFPEIKKNFGFGMMRLPMIGEEVDVEMVKAMTDAFLAAGFNYFDTAHPYIKGKSELALREALTSRYPPGSLHHRQQALRQLLQGRKGHSSSVSEPAGCLRCGVL